MPWMGSPVVSTVPGPPWSKCQEHHNQCNPQVVQGRVGNVPETRGPLSHSHHPLPGPNRGPAVLALRGFWDVRLSAPKPEKSQDEQVTLVSIH